MPGALEVPPVPGELLARSLEKVARRTRYDVARNRAFDINAHESVSGGRFAERLRKDGFSLGRACQFPARPIDKTTPSAGERRALA